MVSNEEIKRMLDAKRRGIDIKNDKIKSENYKVCPHCKTKNPEKALFCVHCGRKLDKNLEIKCPSCGIKNTKTAKFCVGCGESLNKELPETSDIEKSEVDKKSAPNNDSKVDETALQKPESDKLKKPIKTSIPPSVPEHGIISKTTGLKKTCPSCNGKNLKNAKFCVVCGKKFDDETESIDEKESIKEKPIIVDDDNSQENSDIESSTKTTSPEIKVPENILKIKETTKNQEINTEKDIDNIQDEIEPKKSEEKIEQIDPVEKIKKAKELLDIGAITSEEFENIKKKYINLI